MIKLLNVYLATTLHKFWVAVYMLKFSARLAWRAIVHDLSKYSIDEAAPLSLARKLSCYEYGSQEYKEAMAGLSGFTALHYARNDHHPEHWGTMDAMPLLAQIEAVCDWKAAARRGKCGCIEKSIEVNRERFKLDQNPYLVKTIQDIAEAI